MGVRIGQFDRRGRRRSTEAATEDYSKITSETSVRHVSLSDPEAVPYSPGVSEWVRVISSTDPASEGGRPGAQYGDFAA